MLAVNGPESEAKGGLEVAPKFDSRRDAVVAGACCFGGVARSQLPALPAVRASRSFSHLPQ